MSHPDPTKTYEDDMQLEKDPRKEVFETIISDNYPLHKELEKLSPTEFMTWLERELN